MKIFSNFDTKLKQREYERFVKTFGSDKVLLIERSAVFILWKICLPIVLYCALISCIAYVVYIYMGMDSAWIIIGLGALVSLLYIGQIIKIIIDQYMDFAVLTPDNILMYNQRGLLNRSAIALESLKLKALVLRKKGLLYSIFDIGDLTFITEGDQSQADFTLHYVNKPDYIKKRAYEILKTNLPQ